MPNERSKRSSWRNADGAVRTLHVKPQDGLANSKLAPLLQIGIADSHSIHERSVLALQAEDSSPFGIRQYLTVEPRHHWVVEHYTIGPVIPDRAAIGHRVPGAASVGT